MMYIELHTSSAFSFLDGASLPEALIDRAAALGYPALALLDRDGVYGAPRFHLAAQRAGIKAIVGAELTVASGARDRVRVRGARTRIAAPAPRRTPPRRSSGCSRCPVLIESRDGYRNLCRLVTTMKLRAAKGEGALTFDDLDGHVGGLVALAGRTAIDGAPFRRRRARRSHRRRVRRVAGLRRAAAASPARAGVGQPDPARARRRVSRAGDCHQRRALRRAVGSAALRRAHLHPPQDHARARRTPADLQRRALSEVAGGDGAAVRRSAAGGRRHRRARRPPRLHDGRSRLSLPRISGAAGRDDGVVPAQDDAGGRARALSAVRRSRAPADRARARSDREARSRRLLPDRLGHRQLLPPARHPGAGARLGGQQRGVLQPRHHRRRSDRHGSAVRAVPVGRARRVAGHRSRSAERRSPRAGDPAHVREVRHARQRRGRASR